MSSVAFFLSFLFCCCCWLLEDELELLQPTVLVLSHILMLELTNKMICIFYDTSATELIILNISLGTPKWLERSACTRCMIAEIFWSVVCCVCSWNYTIFWQVCWIKRSTLYCNWTGHDKASVWVIGEFVLRLYHLLTYKWTSMNIAQLLLTESLPNLCKSLQPFVIAVSCTSVRLCRRPFGGEFNMLIYISWTACISASTSVFNPSAWFTREIEIETKTFIKYKCWVTHFQMPDSLSLAFSVFFFFFTILFSIC